MYKFLKLAGFLLLTGMAFGQGQFSGGGGGGGVSTASQVVALFTGCSGTQYLGADNACHNAGTGTVSANNGTAGAIANYAAAGGSTTIGPDANLVDAGGQVWNAAIITLNFTGASGPVFTTPATNTDFTFTPNGTGGVVFPQGAPTSAAIKFSGDTANAGIYRSGALGYSFTTGGAAFATIAGGAGYRAGSALAFGWASSTASTGAFDTCVSRSAAGIILADSDSACSNGLGSYKAQLYTTTANCAGVGTAANPSVVTCAGASAGSFSCATNASGGTCTVNTTAVNTNSEIIIHQRSDTVTGTRLGVTCNTGISTTVEDITAVVAATSFSINLGTITTNPECFSFLIINQ